MTQRDTVEKLSHALPVVISTVCWMAATAPQLPATELGEMERVAGLGSTLTENLDRRARAGYTLGLEAGAISEWGLGCGFPAGATTVARITPTTGSHDWRSQQVPIGYRMPATSSGTGQSELFPDRPYGWKQLRYDVGYVFHKPARLDAKEKRTALALGGTTVLLYVFREDIQKAWRENRSQSRTDFLNSARVMGGAGFAPVVALASYVASFATHNEREKETAQLVLESWALSAVGSGIGSFVLAAERPEDGDAMRFFATDGHGVSYDVSVAASVIPPLRRQYLRVRPKDAVGTRILKHGISALLYGGMVLTALQRIDADKHWAPDVFLGAVNGIGVGTVLGQAHDETRDHRSQLGVSALPGGLAVTWTLNLDPR